ncbi:unnamed protein product, partial [Didymodactylos carnosus]
MEELQLENEAMVGSDEKGPEVLEAEIEAAIGELKSGKAEGVDGIPAELLKALGERGRKEPVGLCRSIYVTGDWPVDFIKSTIVTLE